MVTTITTLIVCITVLIIAYRFPFEFTININKRIIVPEPPTITQTTPNPGYIKEENHQHTELLHALNDILTDFNGGDHGKPAQ